MKSDHETATCKNRVGADVEKQNYMKDFAKFRAEGITRNSQRKVRALIRRLI